MELENFDYEKRPIFHKKYFEVHSLSNHGFNQYISSDSYSHKYLKKYPQKFINELYQEIQNHNESLLKREENKYEENNIYYPSRNLNINEISPDKSNKIELDPVNLEDEEKNELEKKNFDSFKIKSRRNKSVQLNFNKTNNEFFNSCKSNLDPLTRRLNITGSNFKNTKNSKENIFRYDKNYLSNLNYIANNESYIFSTDKEKELKENKKKNYNGFLSYNIPRLITKVKDYTKPTFQFSNKIEKTLAGDNKINQNSVENLKKFKEENEKLKSIIKIQTSSDFLKKTKLPEISYIVNQPKLRINNDNEKLKFMGGRYNPYNFQAGRDCEPVRRNHVGGLYNH